MRQKLRLAFEEDLGWHISGSQGAAVSRSFGKIECLPLGTSQHREELAVIFNFTPRSVGSEGRYELAVKLLNCTVWS